MSVCTDIKTETCPSTQTPPLIGDARPGWRSHAPAHSAGSPTGAGETLTRWGPHRGAGLSALALLLLHLCVTHGTAPWEERALHRAIRHAFAR